MSTPHEIYNYAVYAQIYMIMYFIKPLERAKARYTQTVNILSCLNTSCAKIQLNHGKAIIAMVYIDIHRGQTVLYKRCIY